MRVACAAALLVLLTASCTRAKPDAPLPEPKAVAKSAPATVRPRTATRPAPKVAGVAVAPAARTSAAAPALDLKTLTQQLRATKAIGIFTKITLKNQVDDLLDGFREYYQGTSKLALTDLRRSFDLLMMKVLSLLQNDDQMLASAIASSRHAIWGVLADRNKFANLDV
jgi:hypothetical protein